MGRIRISLLAACFFFSGLAGLVFQTAWTQQLSFVFGASHEAIVAVLAAYMAGLATGATAAGRVAGRLRRPVLTYGLLELGIAVTSLAVPGAIALAGRLQAAWLGGGPLSSHASATTAFHLATAFAVLLVPTALMGATLPLLARHAVVREKQIGPRVAWLYAANTAGAAAGTLVTAFWLLPNLGLGPTLQAAAGVNVLVFFLVLLWLRGQDREQRREPAQPSPVVSPTGWILPLILMSGAVSFCWEVVWSRLLVHLLGGSVFAFSVMLASFLVALAAGSALAGPLATTAERARLGFVVAQLASAGLSLAAFAAVDHLPSWVSGSKVPGLWAALIIVPGALAIGATFPCAVRILARDAEDTASASARVFSWNTVGAILGALLTGYVALPYLRFAGTATAAVALSLALAAAAAFWTRPRRRMLGGFAVVGLALLAVRPPSPPWNLLRHTPLAGRAVPGEVTHFAAGRSSTVLLTEQHGHWRLLTNGLPESSIESPAQRVGRHLVARWLALLPQAVRPEMSSMLVVGLGAGLTIERIPATVRTIDVVELEPEVLRANQVVAERRRQDPLADPRVRVHFDDARSALRLTDQRFSAIVSQPSHPWTSGAAHLYTREFFSLVRERLTPQGVFAQWMAFAFVDEPLLRSLVATALEVFDHVELYRPQSGSVLILASQEPMDIFSTATTALARTPREWADVGVRYPEDLIATRILDDAATRRFAAGMPPLTDDRNALRMRSARLGMRALGARGGDRLLAGSDPSPHLGPLEGFDRNYLLRRMIHQGTVERARNWAQAFEQTSDRYLANGLAALAEGDGRAGQRELQKVLRLDRQNPEALAAMAIASRQAIATGQPVPLLARGDKSLATVTQGWRLDTIGDWQALSRLESALAKIDGRHPLFAEATRLRCRWRIASGDPAEARRALDLLTPLLSPTPTARDLLLRARAGGVAGETGIALAAVEEALAQPLAPRFSAAVTRDARSLLRTLQPEPQLAAWHRDLEKMVGER